METIEKKAYAKINIVLDVVGKRDDGYHDLDMIMQTVDLFDVVTVSKNNTGEIIVVSDDEMTGDMQKNLAYIAVEKLLEYKNIKNVGITVDIKKNIPIAGGMAGGSSDCATTLKCVNELLELGCTLSELADIGKSIGADVPYCVYGGTMRVRGVGDKLTKLKNHKESWLLIVRPDVYVNTGEVFRKFVKDENENEVSMDMLIQYLENDNIEMLASNMRNDLEKVTVSMYAIIDEIKKTMMDCKSIGSMMTGSGATVFGYFENYDDAAYAQKIVKEKMSNITHNIITRTVNGLN